MRLIDSIHKYIKLYDQSEVQKEHYFMVKIYKEVQKHYEKGLSRGPLVAGSESESRQIKEIFFDLGQKTVSDRDVFTFEYLLTKYMVQSKGFRAIEDSLFPYLTSSENRPEVLKAIEWVKSFPDPFLENEVFDVLLEYFSEEEEYKVFGEQLESVKQTILKVQDSRMVPRSFSKLFQNEALLDGELSMLSTALERQPYSFQERFTGGVVRTGALDIEWNRPLELFDKLSSLEMELDFLNYSDQIQEVRGILSLLAKFPEKKNVVLFPKNAGYEKLFFTYQKEFFKEQIFFVNKQEESNLEKYILNIRKESSFVKTVYSGDVQNPNKVSLEGKMDLKYSFKELVDKYFDLDFRELDLNICSSLVTQLGSDIELLGLEWATILEAELIKAQSKYKNLSTEFKFGTYEYFPIEDMDGVYIMGWGDHLFKRTGEKLFPNNLLFGIEFDLGLDLKSLNESQAKTLFQNPLFSDERLVKTVTYAEKTSLGKSVEPGVFKILWEKKEKGLSECSRIVVMAQPFERSSSEMLEYSDKKLSASSLQKYEDCPYKFYLEKVIGLKVEDEEDYFLSAKEEGLLIHKALEELNKEDLSEGKFKKLVKELALSKDPDFNSFREGAVEQLSSHLWLVVNEESVYLKEKSISTIQKEQFFSFYADIKGKAFSKDKGDFRVNGLIDRVDINEEGKALLYDYKRKDTGTFSLSRYSGGQLAPQLFLYCLAADKGFLSDFKELAGFQYINIKSYRRIKGFVDKDLGLEMAKEIPSGSAITREKFEDKVNMFLDKFWKVLEKIESNEFDAKPASPDLCKTCDWVGICKKSETFL